MRSEAPLPLLLLLLLPPLLLPPLLLPLLLLLLLLPGAHSLALITPCIPTTATCMQEEALSHRNLPPHRKVVFTLGRLYDHLLPPGEIDRLETGEIRLAAAGLLSRAGDLPQQGEEEEAEEENEDGGEGGQAAGRGATVRISR